MPLKCEYGLFLWYGARCVRICAYVCKRARIKKRAKMELIDNQ